MAFSLRHTYRENNCIADYLTNFGCKAQRKVIFHDCMLIPRKARGDINEFFFK